MRKKLLKSVGLVLFLLVFLTGCTVKNENEMNITKDGKLDYSIILSFDKEVLSNLVKTQNMSNNSYVEVTDEDIKSYLESNLNDSYLEGFDKKEYLDGNFIGYKYTLNIDNIDNVISKDKNVVILNDLDSENKLKDMKLFTKKDKEYSANFKLEKIELNDEENDSNVNFYTTFKVTLPSSSETNNAKYKSNNGRTLEWVQTNNEDININFTFQLKSNYTLYILFLILGTLLSLLCYFLKFINKSKKVKKIYIITSIILLGLFSAFIYINYYIKSTKNKETTVSSNNTNLVELKDSKIEINEKVLKNSLSVFEKYFNYNVDEVYTNIYDKTIKTDGSMKITTNEGVKTLSVKLNENDYKNLFNQYTNEYTENVNILFDENNEYADNLDFKINKEDILRKKIVETAVSQVGKGGEDYWKWYGFNSRHEWCAIFVSWLGGQYGLIDADIYPKFVWVKIGVDYFKEKKQFKYRKEYTPKPGDVIFFDWNNNEVIDHVGIVEKVENNTVYTVEGNVKYLYVAAKEYKLTSSYIYGYGIPDYASYEGKIN